MSAERGPAEPSPDQSSTKKTPESYNPTTLVTTFWRQRERHWGVGRRAWLENLLADLTAVEQVAPRDTLVVGENVFYGFDDAVELGLLEVA